MTLAATLALAYVAGCAATHVARNMATRRRRRMYLAALTRDDWATIARMIEDGE